MAILQYQPSAIGAGIFGALYLILASIFCYHTIRGKSWKQQWGSCLYIGCIFSALGWLLRIPLRTNPDSIPLYAMSNLAVICSPVCFFAFLYIIYGRFVTHQKTISTVRMNELSPIREGLTGKLFIWTDVATFIVQMGGGGLQASGGNNRSLSEIGDKVFLVGIILQGVLFLCFVGMTIFMQLRFVHYKQDRTACQGFFYRIYWAAVFLIIRTIFRCVEMAQGYTGYLFTHEIYLFVLDAAMIILAIGVFAVFWPAKYLEDNLSQKIGSEVSIDEMQGLQSKY